METPSVETSQQPPKAPQPTRSQGFLVDIDAELAYWTRVFPTTEFYRSALKFDKLVPTIKFGYDCYLLFHHRPLAELLPSLRSRYQSQVPAHAQIDWRWADQILRHTWGRMRAE